MEIEAIQKLIDTDEKTRARIDAQYKKRFALKQAIEDEKKKLSDEAWAAVKKQVSDEKAKLDAKIAEEEKANEAYYAKASAQLQKMYDDNKDQWCKDLVQKVITSDAE